MMYSNKLAMCVKHNGKVLREQGEQVLLPFGSEFSLYFKNMNIVRVLVSVEIDGKDATGGVQLIVPANGSIDLERFIENGNLSAGHRFKFIERTAAIEDHRGIKAEDGLIRVQYEFEREPAPVVTYNYLSSTCDSFTCDSFSDSGYNKARSAKLGSIMNSANSLKSCGAAAPAASSDYCGAAALASVMDFDFEPEAGITVAGSKSDQQFKLGAWFPTTGVKHVMVLKLMGYSGTTPVVEPVTVKTKTKCPTCGTKNKGSAKFCTECGTNLEQL
jgi:hypothetical protein